MKKPLVILTALLVLICSHSIAQKIIMKIDGITAVAGEEVRAVEFKITAATSWSLGGGASVGKPKLGDFVIKKTNNTSTNELSKKILTGAGIPLVIFEYYSAADDKLPYFTITLKDAFVSNFFWLSPECPTCLKLEHQVAFVPKIIETFDAVTGKTVGYNITTGIAY